MARMMVYLAFLGAVTALGGVAPLRAQETFCKTALAMRRDRDVDSDLVSPALMSAHPALETLDTAILNPLAQSHASDPLQMGSRVWPSGTAALGYALIFTSDTGYARATAVYLTRFMAGSSRGMSPDQAWAASQVYAAWHLPPEPALTLLRANWATPASRSYALAAIGSHVRDSSFYLAGVAALCSLAARSAGVAEWLGVSDTTPTYELLDDEEDDFLSRLGWAFDQYLEARVGRIETAEILQRVLHGQRPQLRAYLPERNPVSAHMRRWNPELW